MSELKRLGEYRSMVNASLATYFAGRKAAYSGLHEAMRYSLLAGGKRIRPALTLEFCRVSGAEPGVALAAACAMEMLHTYTLIHDDLPCMDDDELRRGRPTNHVVFGQATAVLAGDALQAEAFGVLLSSPVPAERLVHAARVLAEAAGSDGVCAGQFLDMREESAADVQALYEIHGLKTAMLIAASAMIGVICGGGSEAQVEAAREYAQAIGIAFQVRDDMLDATAETEALGKPSGSDAKGGKKTFMSLFGEARCAEIVQEHTLRAKEAAKSGFDDCGFLCELADMLAGRGN